MRCGGWKSARRRHERSWRLAGGAAGGEGQAAQGGAGRRLWEAGVVFLTGPGEGPPQQAQGGATTGQSFPKHAKVVNDSISGQNGGVSVAPGRSNGAGDGRHQRVRARHRGGARGAGRQRVHLLPQVLTSFVIQLYI